MAASGRTGLTTEVEVDPTIFFEDVFAERTAQLRERAARLRDELSRDEDDQQGGGRVEG